MHEQAQRCKRSNEAMALAGALRVHRAQMHSNPHTAVSDLVSHGGHGVGWDGLVRDVMRCGKWEGQQ